MMGRVEGRMFGWVGIASVLRYTKCWLLNLNFLRILFTSYIFTNKKGELPRPDISQRDKRIRGKEPYHKNRIRNGSGAKGNYQIEIF